jgi:hypothetical protein
LPLWENGINHFKSIIKERKIESISYIDVRGSHFNYAKRPLTPKKLMKEYKVETLIYYSKLTSDSKHIAKSSKKEIQEKLDEYAEKGYRLASTDATNFGFAVYIYLYFEKEA